MKPLLHRINDFIRSHSPARKLTPQESINITIEEAKFISQLPQLNVKNRFTYSVSEVNGRPALCITDSYTPTMPTTAYLIGSHDKLADGYTALHINHIVNQLNDYQTIQFIIHSYKDLNYNPKL